MSEGKNVTTDNTRFIRYMWEVEYNKIGAYNKDWFPCAMGGEYRKWYGNVVNVISWSEKSRLYYKKAQAGRIIREEFWHMPGITWGKIGSAASSFRVLMKEQMYQETAILQKDSEDSFFILALLNSKPASFFLEFLSPTINFQLQDICSIPIPEIDEEKKRKIKDQCCKCIEITKKEWNLYECSNDFVSHPLVLNESKSELLNERFVQWEKKTDEWFEQLKNAEEEINRMFISLYRLDDELNPYITDKENTVRKANLQREIRSLLSYAVGCVFGRYSIDKEGIIYAGGEWDANNYTSFVPVSDNVIPITDEEYFEDDIVGLFCKWLKQVYGSKSLEENLDFIANALGNKGDSSREVIRNYFLKDFFADHCKTYQKRPIYWLFDSGKENGFKALVYLHRYDADTVGRVRTDYLHKEQSYVEAARRSAEYTVENSSSSSEKSKATKAVAKYTKQLAEMKIYDEAIAHIANQRIELDLDDGVKVNYEKFQGIEVSREGQKAVKIDLLAKIK